MQILHVVVEGYLSEEQLVKVLAPVNAHLERNMSTSCGVVIDILKMTGYAPEARVAYVKWHQKSHHRLKGVAVVTSNKLWRMVIAAIGITTSLRAFESAADATQWLEQMGAHEGRSSDSSSGSSLGNRGNPSR